MTDTTSNPEMSGATEVGKQSARTSVKHLGLDNRLVGMIVALGLMWVVFNYFSDGLFLTSRNLWNLSVQSSAVAILATGMVLVIVSRNIDLSVGSIAVFIAMMMGLAQAEWIPDRWGLGRPWTWIVVLLGGIVLGGLVGALHGVIVAYVKVPSFIVTLGGLLVWRAVAFQLADGRTIAPLDTKFQLLGGGPKGSLGDTKSWLVAAAACAVIVAGLVVGRRRRQRHGFTLRPLWIEAVLGSVGCGAILGAVWIANSYLWPPGLAKAYAEEHGITEPSGGLRIATGIAIPVLITVGVALAMTYLATRRKFGRHLFSLGGNPEAAELAGINTRLVVVKTFVVMGMLAALGAAVISARLNAATSGLGTGLELQVIAAAVIGGTSLAGGVGTIPGAILGAVVMQSLSSGMVLMKVPTATQDIVVGVILVAAVAFDSILNRRRT